MTDPHDRLRELVHGALHDDATFMDDGPWGDERERDLSVRHAWEVRRFFHGGRATARDLDLIASAVREPGVDAGRARTLLFECSQILCNDEGWRALWRGIVGDPTPRIRLLALGVDGLYCEHFLKDPDPSVRHAALCELGRVLNVSSSHALVKEALRDEDARIRKSALDYAIVLDDWRAECERLRDDPDERVRQRVPEAIEAGTKAEAARAKAKEERARRPRRR